MVKADAYGHGAIEVAKATVDACDMFGVATVEEGIALRKAGIDKEILVAYASSFEIDSALTFGLTLAISSCEQLKALVCLKNEKTNAKKTAYQNIKVHLKLDTGMHRLGFMPDELECVIQIAKQNEIEIVGIYSHLRTVNDSQLDSFLNMSERLKHSFPNATRHLCSSSSLYRPDMQFDMVRVGLSAYENAMTVASEVIAAKYLPQGEHIGYGDFTLDHNANVAIVFGGYADGIARENPSNVCIRGCECRVLGRVCMDMFFVETNGFVADVGELVVLQGKGAETAQVACSRDTIEYTVLTSWRGRTQRIYFDDKSARKEMCRK